LKPEIAENSLYPHFWISRTFKVIDAGTSEKVASSACYDEQQVCLSATSLVLY